MVIKSIVMNTELGKKISELRKRKGNEQGVGKKSANLNVRTVQEFKAAKASNTKELYI